MAQISDNRKRKYMRDDFAEAYKIEDKEKAKIKRALNKRKIIDEKYSSLVIVIKNELTKRKININDNDFDLKIDEIISNALQIPSIRKRYPDAEIVEIRNAVKRSINREINDSKSNEDR